MNSKSAEITVYKPGSRAMGFFSAFKLAVFEIAKAREVIWELFRRDFKAQYKQKLLGQLWIIITPLLTVASFGYMYVAGVIKPGPIGMPYPIYVLVGTTIWGIMVESINSMSQVLIQQADLIQKTGVPKIAISFSGTGNFVYVQLINIFILIVVSFLLGAPPTFGFLLFPILILPMFLIGISFGLILSVINVIARDISSAVVAFLRFFMFLCPVVYAPSFENPILLKLVKYNPFTYLVNYPRQVAFAGNFEGYTNYLYVYGATILLLLLSIKIFYAIEDKVAERL